ncbi:UNVERIFIED_ORG: G3E family GTPase [Arthrobacter sp. UYEF2]
MQLTVISSLDALCRQQACQDAAAATPGDVVVLHDLLENGVVIRRIFSQSRLLESAQTQLEHGCLSCTVRLDLFPADPALRVRGVQPVRELAPHADVVEKAGLIRPGRHDFQDALSRTVPGSVRIPASASTSPFTTVTHRSQRPLHPERFRHALASLAAGCCWLRGRLWIGAAPQCRIVCSPPVS